MRFYNEKRLLDAVSNPPPRLIYIVDKILNLDDGTIIYS